MAKNKKRAQLEKVRNFGIAAHIDAGKTTLTERVLYLTGMNYKIGEVHEGTAYMDYMPEERARGITITSAVTHCTWNDHDLHLIDTPGHVDFTIEVERSMRVLDGVVIVLDAVKGVEPQTETVWRQAERHQVPRILFVNKMDRMGADFKRALDTVEARLNGKPVAVAVPIEYNGGWGILDLVKAQWITFSGDRNIDVHRDEIPGDLQDIYEEWHEQLIEFAADISDDLAEKYLGGEEISEAELVAVLRQATADCQVQLTLGGSALKDFGVQPVLDAVLDYLPSPLDVAAVKGEDAKTGEEKEVELTESGPFCGLIFKVQMFDGRRYCYMRIYRGKIKPGDQVYNNRLGKMERVARIFGVTADRRDRLQEAGAGDLVLCAGLRDATTGDTLSDQEHPVSLAPIEANEPVIALSIETIRTEQDDKVLDSIAKMVQEDPTLKFVEDPDSGQRLLYGMGELHLEVVLDRMQREYGVGVRTGRPRVVYRESIAASSTKSMVVKNRVEPFEPVIRVVVEVSPASQESEAEVHFDADAIKVLPEGSTLSVVQQEWLRDSMKSEAHTGPGGFRLVGVDIRVKEVELFGQVQEPAVREGAALSVRQAILAGDHHLLAPIMAMEIEVPGESVGSVIGDLQSRGGIVMGMEAQEDVTQVKAECAMEKLFGYATDIRSMTQGRGTFTLRFSRYDRIAGEVQVY